MKTDIKKEIEPFIFSVTQNIKFHSNNYDNSIECNSNFGPVFGFGGDLTIVDCFLQTKSNMWTVAETYGDKYFSITNGQQQFQLVELEVYEIRY